MNKEDEILKIKEKNENLNDGIKILIKYKKFKKKKQIKRLEDKKEISNKSFTKLIIILVVIFLVVSLVNFIRFSTILGFKLYSKDDSMVVIENINYEESYIDEYNKEILIVKNNEISTYNKKGDLTWNYKVLNMYNPDVYIRGNYIILSDKKTSTIYVFNGKNQISSKKIEGTILDVFVDEYGNYIVENATTSYNKKISLFNKNSKLKEEIFLKLESIIDIQILNNAKELVILTANTKSLNIGTDFNYINLKNKEDNIKTLYTLENEIVTNLKINNRNLIMQTNEGIKSFNIDNKNINEIYEYNDNNTSNTKLEDNYYLVINDEEKAHYVQTFNYEGFEVSKNLVSNIPKYISSNKYIICLVSENSIDIYNKWGTLLKNIKIDFLPRKVIITNNSTAIALIYGNTIEIYDL